MNRIVLGAVAALLLAAAGVFWWQGRAATEIGAALPVAGPQAALADPASVPDTSGRGLRGPSLPFVPEATREQRRFDRLDRDRDDRITRNEMMVVRVDAFRKLDTDGNNLLSFEEWAVRTGNRFKSADANGDGALNRPEFATTKPKQAARPDCRCAPAQARSAQARPAATRRGAPAPVAEEAEDELEVFE